MAQEDYEIGGYLELERFSGNEYHADALALNSARACLLYLLEARSIESIWVPSFLCASVERAANAAGAVVKTYPITRNFLPEWNSIQVADNDYLYLVDYYGQLPDEDIEQARERFHGRIIVDEVMAFFRKPLGGMDTLYSCRKFFGVSDGAYLYTDAKLDRELPADESHAHLDFVLGRFERPASEFYARSSENNSRFIEDGIRLMSPLTHNILRAVDYDEVARVRKENFELLHAGLGEANLLAPICPPGPFMYPLLLHNGGDIRPLLHRRKLYIPMLWDHAEHAEGVAGEYARNILPLPVDQRYGAQDMAHIIDILSEHL